MIKPIAKSAARGVAAVLASPLVAGYWIARTVMTREEAFAGACEWASMWPGIVGSYVRVAMLRATLKSCAADCRIGFGVLMSKPDAVIGRHAYIGPRCSLGLVTVEPDALIGPGVHVLSGARTHDFQRTDKPYHEQGGESVRVVIGAGAWVGAGAVVMADIGPGAVVGAGSVVTKPIPPRVVAAGAPARVLREIGDASDDQATTTRGAATQGDAALAAPDVPPAVGPTATPAQRTIAPA